VVANAFLIFIAGGFVGFIGGCFLWNLYETVTGYQFGLEGVAYVFGSGLGGAFIVGMLSLCIYLLHRGVKLSHIEDPLRDKEAKDTFTTQAHLSSKRSSHDQSEHQP
jgi:hypothetical protein